MMCSQHEVSQINFDQVFGVFRNPLRVSNRYARLTNWKNTAKIDTKKKMLQKTKQPTDTEKMRVVIGIGNWNTAMKHCLELMLAGKINGQRTPRGWIFWSKQEAKTNERR
jgi:hypothetical protein